MSQDRVCGIVCRLFCDRDNLGDNAKYIRAYKSQRTVTFYSCSIEYSYLVICTSITKRNSVQTPKLYKNSVAKNIRLTLTNWAI